MKLSSQFITGLTCLIVSVFFVATFYEFSSLRQNQARVIDDHAAQVASTINDTLANRTASAQAKSLTIQSILETVAAAPYITQAQFESSKNSDAISSKNIGTFDYPAWLTSVISAEKINKRVVVNQEGDVVTLSSNSAYAYALFWTVLVKQTLISSLLLLLSIVIVSGISALSIRPIKRSTKQLSALENHNYALSNLSSFTKEYRYLTNAVNSLAISLERRFTQLSKQSEQFKQVASKDALTGLAKRSAFERHMKALLSTSTTKEMDLTLVRLAQLGRVNAQLGSLAGDSYVVGVANILQLNAQDTYKNAFVFRFSGGDFAIVSNPLPRDEHESTLRSLVRLITNVYPLQDKKKAVSIGVARFSPSEILPHIVEKADNALIAATKLEQGWQFASDIQHVHSSAKWRERLTYIVEQQYADILIQPIVNIEQNAPAYHEIFARFKDSETNTVIPMSQLIPASERLELIPQLDKLVVSMVFKKLSATSHQVGINLSNMSISSASFREWLLGQLRQREEVCRRLVFEIEDSALIHHSDDAIALCKQIMQCGAQVTVEHFGDNFSSLAGLRAISPQFVKLSGRLTQSIHLQKDNQLFISSLLSIARNLHIEVIAEMVENEAESISLENLNVTFQQGYYFAKPTLWMVY